MYQVTQSEIITFYAKCIAKTQFFFNLYSFNFQIFYNYSLCEDKKITNYFIVRNLNILFYLRILYCPIRPL